jgi:hypothetical protein
MADENNSTNQNPDAKQSDPDGAKNGIIESKSGALQQPDPKNTGNAADKPPKAVVPVRLWHALWRKRIIFHHGGPNWAEISVVILTGGILLVGAVQAIIYWEQAQKMQLSLEQNQQSIALNTGQVAIAGRNAKTAEDTLGEIKKGGTDTHNLAEAAGKQADAASKLAAQTQIQAQAALSQVGAMQSQAEATKEQAENTKEALKHSDDAFRTAQQPYITVGDKDGVIAKFIPPTNPSDWTGLVLYLRNSGHLPATPVCVSSDVAPGLSISQPTYQWYPLYRMVGTEPPQSFNVHGNGGCQAIGGDSVYRYVISKALRPGILEKVKAATPSNPLFLNTVVEYCSPLGNYSCKIVFARYDPPPIDGFTDLGEDECTYLYGRLHPLPPLSVGTKFTTLPCEQPGEAEERAKEEREYWRTHTAPQPQPK